MATVTHAAPTAEATPITTEANSLADGSFCVDSGSIDNETGEYLYASFELELASLTPTAGGYVGLYIIPTLDGTNFGDSTTPPETALAAVFPVTSTTGAKRVMAFNIPLPPLEFKCVLGNHTGVAFGASGNVLTIRRHNIDVA